MLKVTITKEIPAEGQLWIDPKELPNVDDEVLIEIFTEDIFELLHEAEWKIERTEA